VAGHTSWAIVAFTTASDTAIGEIAMRATFGGANQCTGGTATVSHATFGHLGTDAFDGSSATWWQAGGGVQPTSIVYTKGAAFDVVELAMTSPDDATAYTYTPTAFYLTYSDDAFATPGVIAYETYGLTWARNETKLFNIGAAAGNIEATKAVTYVPLGPPLLQSCTKAVMYVITGPDNGARQRLTVRYVRSHR
jgi:hypothetical protein